MHRGREGCRQINSVLRHYLLSHMAPRFQKLLKDGSDFDLWMAVAVAALDRRSSRGIESLTRVQMLAVGVWVASGMIGNRGFCDHSSEEMAEWAAAYDGLGMPTAAEAIREAARIMPTINWEGGHGPAEQLLNPIERRYYTANKQTAGVVAALIRQRPTEAFAELAEPHFDPPRRPSLER
jgi:hypothetical protein